MNHPAAGATTLRKPLPAALLGERVGASEAVRQQHGRDESAYPHALPDAVVLTVRGFFVLVSPVCHVGADVGQ